MTTLLLRLAGPLQSWGSSSRFVRRGTDAQPTRSGVVGLLAASLGRRRTDPIEDLLDLEFGVRIDQPGQLERDFQTARSLDGAHALPLTYRFYLADACFLAAVAGPDDLVDALAAAVSRPAFPLYLGRRSCPPAVPPLVGVRDGDVVDVLAAAPWAASRSWQRRTASSRVQLELVVDRACWQAAVASGAVSAAAAGSTQPGGVYEETVRDLPLSFDPRLRTYGWRRVARSTVTVDNPSFLRRPAAAVDEHEPLAALGGG